MNQYINSTERKKAQGILLLRGLGLGLSLACCIYILTQHGSSLKLLLKLNPASFGYILIAVLCWVGVNTCLGLGWAKAIELQNPSLRANIKASIFLNFRTQIGKYLPGNVFHFAGRFYYAKKMGLAHKSSTFSTLFEAGSLSLLALVLSTPLILSQLNYLLIPISLLSIAILYLFYFTLFYFFNKRPPPLTNWATWLQSIAYYLALLILQTCLFLVLQTEFAPELNWSLDKTISIIAFSWIAGFLAFGAPGGLGVREAVMLHYADSTSSSAIFLCVAIMRIASLIADVICYLISQCIRLDSLKIAKN